MILESINDNGWVTGVPLGTETPGLMTGLAGIGYELLRLAAPEKVPSVLLIEPPFSSPAAHEWRNEIISGRGRVSSQSCGVGMGRRSRR